MPGQAFGCGGSDTAAIGLATRSSHHVALDTGSLGITDYHVRVFADACGQTMVDELLVRFSGAPLRAPQAGFPPPGSGHVRWHGREVFRKPARPAT